MTQQDPVIISVLDPKVGTQELLQAPLMYHICMGPNVLELCLIRNASKQAAVSLSKDRVQVLNCKVSAQHHSRFLISEPCIPHVFGATLEPWGQRRLH